MKILKNILYISLITSSFVLGNEEEVKTMEIDGTLYKINPSSIHITPYEDDNKVLSEASKLNDSAKTISKKNNDADTGQSTDNGEINLYINTGALFPFGSDDRATYSTGSSLGFTYMLPKTFKIFNNEISTGVELNFANLSANQDLKINSIIGHFSSSFNTPINFDFGVGLTEGVNGLAGSALMDLTYMLPIEKFDLGISLRLQKIIEVNKDYEIDFDAQDLLYGLSLKIGRSVSFK
ncbi:MAG: hypothetical protein CMG09_00590 [Candidatus Marinimicrobia bacterium]|nr:hypothetical protein [Candidatus Neomarinimicrobiota bacterium]|tara:strand:+ start:1721 stop:2431 length:711 start_codon:yes stop_codon:yes gene_type:complete